MEELKKKLDAIIDQSLQQDYVIWPDDRVRKAEKHIGAHFSDDYVFYLQNYGCNYLKDNHCFSSDREVSNEIIDFDIGGIFGLYDTVDNLEKNYDNCRVFLPKNLFPIADSAGGDYICMSKKKGDIYFWAHDIVKNVLFLADSFSDFIFGIKRIEKEKANLDDVKLTLDPDVEEAFRKMSEKYNKK